MSYSELYTELNPTQFAAVAGILPAPAQGPHTLDYRTELVVWPPATDFDIAPATDLELWNGANAVVIGYEVLQFRDCVQNDDGSWTLTNLLRGRRGTEWACGIHVIGELIILLDSTSVTLNVQSLDTAGQTLYFKAIASGQSESQAATTQLVYYPRDLMPYSPADIRRSFSSGNIVITWARRTRIGGGWRDNTGVVPLQEDSESYEVYILTGPYTDDATIGELPTNILRSYTATSETKTYTLANQITDGFDWTADTLYLAIFQVSDAVSRGFPGLATITFDAPSYEAVVGSRGVSHSFGHAAAVGMGGRTVGSAAGLGHVSGVGRSTGTGVGAAHGTGSATAVASKTASSVGAGTGTGAASGVGRAVKPAVGSASGTGATSGAS